MNTLMTTHGVPSDLVPEKLMNKPPFPPKRSELDQETVNLLKEYLEHAKVERAQKKEDKIIEMLEKSQNWQLEHDAMDKSNFKELKGDIRSLDVRVRSVEEDVDKLQHNIEDTGRHNMKKLEDELERRRRRDEKRRELNEQRRHDAREWLRRHWIPTVVTILSLAVAIYSALRK